MYDLIPTPEAYELEPAVAWDMWDTAVRMQDVPSATTSPAFDAHMQRNRREAWQVGQRHL